MQRAFPDDVVVDFPSIQRLALFLVICNAQRAERRITNRQVELPVRKFSFLKSCGGFYLRVWIKMLGNQASDGINFRSKPVALSSHCVRHQPDKIPGPDRWFQYSPAGEAHVPQETIHRIDNWF